MKFVTSLVCMASAAAALAASQAHADTVDATLFAQYFQVADGTDPDFSGGFPVVADGSKLGPNGLPVATSGVADVDSSGEIEWWSPALDSNVKATGTGYVSLPYDSNMYPPNSTGAGDGVAFETAEFTGQFTLTSASTVSFDLGSDDDSFIYVDGTLFGQNPGIHGVSYVDFTTQTLSAGAHDIEIFYADREQVGAVLDLNLDAASSGVVITPVSGAPEPAAWALMILGVSFVGGMLRFGKRMSSRKANGAVLAA